ncbi:Ras-specific guanine nucleotide-releasing, partial [Globisporangium splendens]
MHAASLPTPLSLTRSRSLSGLPRGQQKPETHQQTHSRLGSPSIPLDAKSMARASSRTSSANSSRQTNGGGVMTPSSSANVSFSAFLMDEIPDFNARPQKNGAMVTTNGVYTTAPTAIPMPALAPQKSTPQPVVVTITSNGQKEDDIPVLEATRDGAFHSDFDGDDDDDDDGEDIIVGGEDSDDDDDDDGDDDQFNEDDYVPVLQTIEDAQAFDKAMRQRPMGSRKFSWRESSRKVTKRKKSRVKKSPHVPDPETLLRMSSQPTELTSNSSSGSLISRKASSISVDKQLVRSGWLYKQADIMKTWKRRFFVLVKRTNTSTGEFSATLQYYKGTNFAKLRGEVHLQDGPLIVRFLEPHESKRPYCFKVARGDMSFICQGTGDEDVTAWVCHLQSLCGGTGEFATSAIGTAAAGGLHPGGMTAGAMDDRSIRIVAELRRLLHTSKSPESVKCKSFVKSFECRSPSALRQFRDFHASLTNSIMKDHANRILKHLEETRQGDSSSSARQLPSVALSDIRSAVSRHVEEVLFTPLQDSIYVFMRRAFQEDDSSINRKVRWLQGKDQTFYSIPLHQISWKEWRKASKVLAQIGHLALPSSKYDVLMNTVSTIQATFGEEHNMVADAEPLETDDIIPIFTYVLANSGLENLLSLKTLLTELNGSWAVGGSLDDGAALSILNHAVDFISNVSIPAVLEDIFKDQITLSIDGDWRRVLEFEVEPTYRYGAIVQTVSSHGYSTVGSTITRGSVLVTINGQSVVLWPFQDIMTLLKESTHPHRLAFIPGNSYFKILTSNKSLWNVALIHACQRGDVMSVQMLLANGADVNYVAYECGGNTPLHVAVSALHFNVVSYILQHGAKVKAIGEYGRTALHMVGAPCTLSSASSAFSASSAVAGTTLRNGANANGSFRPADKIVMIIKKLLAHGAELEAVDIYGNTPLMLLAEKGCLHGIDVLIEADGHLDLNARNWKSGMNALALASREGRYEVVEALLDYGVQVDIYTLRGESALHFAAGIAHRDICKILVEKGCDIETRTNEGLTPLMVAVAKGHGLTPSGRTAVSKQKTHISDLRSSSTHVDESSVVDTIDFFLEIGADKEAVCSLYRLPLHYAALYGGPEIYDYMLEKMGDNAVGEIRDIFGDTANSMAVLNRPSDVSSSATEQDDDDENGDDDDTDEDDDEQEDIPMSLEGCKSVSGEAVVSGDIVTEERDGATEIVAGTFNSIASLLLQSDRYRLDEVDALIWYCEYGGYYREMVDILRELLKRHEGTVKGFYVRRMVLHALNRLVENLKHKVERDMEACDYISVFCEELFPFTIDDDPQCAQWLSASLLPLYVEACRMQRMQEFQTLSFCEDDYMSLKHFLCSAKQSDPSLKFLDDDLFASATGIEIISQSTRRRLSVAGLWTGDAKMSFVVKAEENDPVLYEPSANTITPWQPRGVSRSLQFDRGSRPWILDIDASVIAQQITLFQHYLFSKVKVWVVSQILSRDDVDQRAEMLSYFVKNLDGFMAVMNATNDSSIYRLKKTWGRLSPQARDLWHDLKLYTEKGARPLNKLTKEGTPPLIPYMGVVIQNIIALQEFPDRIEEDLINFKKIRSIGSLISRFLSFQKAAYLLPTDKRVLYPDADACFQRSLKVEPRVEAPNGGS